jgi:2-polyprenyl-3-methyl-5-hydroxy-6-metoxy-1,4-benzoquinol methylase
MITEEELESFYGKEYHLFNKYINNPSERNLKEWQAKAIKQTIPEIKSLLDEGCSVGELIRVARNIGIDAYGFDICPDLEEIAIPEIKKFVKIGKATKIPFRKKFDVVVAIDLFEHIPEHLIERAIQEAFNHSNKYLVTLISKNPQYFGHITIHDEFWWIDKLSKYFVPHKLINLEGIPMVYSLHPNYSHELLKFWIKRQK